ncbi:MAG: NDP-sugar synthase [Dehalococcoidia bacterium]|jgi:mannose-1-phosphate guanylyltransferase
MKAVILVGGEGTRLRPLTCNTTKAMVPILNIPFLEYVLRYLRGHGIKNVILAMSYLPDRIQNHLGDGSELGVRLSYAVEKEPLGTGGAIQNARAHLTEPFFVLNGDVLTGIDLANMMKLHRKVKPKVSIALTPVDNPTMYGVVETDHEDMVENFVEKPGLDEVTTNMINAGIYILDPEVLEYIPPATPSMVERHLFPLLLEKGEPILGYPSDSYWIDIGTPEKYLKAHHDLLSGEAPALAAYWNNLDQQTRREGEHQIHQSASIEGPVLIGEGCRVDKWAVLKGPAVLGPHCQIAEGACVEGAVLWQGVKLGKKALLRNCIVASNCQIGEESQVMDNCVLGDNVVVGKNNKLAPEVKIWPDKRITSGTMSF